MGAEAKLRERLPRNFPELMEGTTLKILTSLMNSKQASPQVGASREVTSRPPGDARVPSTGRGVEDSGRPEPQQKAGHPREARTEGGGEGRRRAGAGR